MTTTIQESASAIRTIRAYNATSVMESRLGSSIDESYRYGKKLVYLSSCFGPLSQILMQVANIIAIVYGAYEVASGKMEFSALVMFLMYFSYFSSGVSTIAGAFGQVQQAMVGDHRINEFEQIDEEQQPHGTDATGLDRPPAVDFHGIDHHYPNNTSKSLNRVSFSVPSRKVTALVGQSGGGKTTCLSLIEGFLAPDCGSLLIDGYELESFDLHALRSDMAYVEQTPSILSGTIRSNIQLGDPQASDETILESIHQVGLRIPGTTDDTILDLPVGAAGVSLSGGQCQRVALARAFIRHPKLLLMDEPTSSLDGIAEASIARLIRKHMKDSTIIYSAHRLSLILEADWIVVIKNGKVIDQGTHNDLAQRCDYYRELITAQTPQGTENN
jgi:ABC-type bacteriocin/lantibiotic exporter with double-glycine peptidase domain